MKYKVGDYITWSNEEFRYYDEKFRYYAKILEIKETYYTLLYLDNSEIRRYPISWLKDYNVRFITDEEKIELL